MEEYRPDPPAGFGYAEFRAARGRYLARLSAAAQIARLERALSLPFPAATEHVGKDVRQPGARPPRGELP